MKYTLRLRVRDAEACSKLFSPNCRVISSATMAFLVYLWANELVRSQETGDVTIALGMTMRSSLYGSHSNWLAPTRVIAHLGDPLVS